MAPGWTFWDSNLKLGVRAPPLHHVRWQNPMNLECRFRVWWVYGSCTICGLEFHSFWYYPKHVDGGFPSRIRTDLWRKMNISTPILTGAHTTIANTGYARHRKVSHRGWFLVCVTTQCPELVLALSSATVCSKFRDGLKWLNEIHGFNRTYQSWLLITRLNHVKPLTSRALDRSYS